MTFKDRWGTEYPEETRKYVKSRKMIDLTRNVHEIAKDITKTSRSTDEAIMEVHEFIKKSMDVGKVPLILDRPVLKASEQVDSIVNDPKAKHLSYNKVILEVALLRSLDIPARPATYACDLSSEPSMLSRSARWLSEASHFFFSFHHATEVFSKRNGKFMLKESWIPEGLCKEFEGTCTLDEKKEWMDGGEIMGIQKFLKCRKVADHGDYPASFSSIVNASVFARKSGHLAGIIDPL